MRNNNNLKQELEKHWEAEVEARQAYVGYQGLRQRLLMARRSQEPSYPFPEQDDKVEEHYPGAPGFYR
jgi:hypothetical protein